MRFYSLLLYIAITTLCSGNSFAQKSEKEDPKLGPNPVYFLDNAEVMPDTLSLPSLGNIINVFVYYDHDAIKRAGAKAKDGVVYIETMAYVRNRFVKLLRNYSSAYDKLYAQSGSDSSFQYILNGKALKKYDEGDLDIKNKHLIQSLEVITADQLRTRYNITDKQAGVVLTTQKDKPVRPGHKKK
ncbi:hypothetical protein QNI16_01780 [Cytophagaceae bacterium YF14B1]|uniref:DUF4252 domain-containing protein n=1 Tax=Xanthocytophaga flava TaxID=3048013 RepID=A0AAE3U6K7_9BACT|nr:hypothetical protein [Xanthocytophaga flavus]MDJ1479193.1 hypothetical protein [Xanthocytophaga flavus]